MQAARLPYSQTKPGVHAGRAARLLCDRGRRSGLIVTAWIASRDAYQYTTTSGQARQIAQDAMATMTRELRDMVPQSSGQPLYGQPTILLASPTEIDFTAPYLNPGMTGAPRSC